MLHWDGEMLPEIRGGRSMDRIAVLVIGYGHEKPMMARRTTVAALIIQYVPPLITDT